jgi:hypothetical protein
MLCGVVLLTVTAESAVAVCGDGVVDGSERCDHGSANGTDGCCSATCGLVDFEGDGFCDAFDSCVVSDLGRLMKEPRLFVSRLDRPAGEQTFRLRGTVIIRPQGPVDPATNGLRLTFHVFYEGDILFDAIAPGGTGWTSRMDGTAWTYHRRAGDMGDITRAVVRRVELPAGTYLSPGFEAFAFVIQGRDATYRLEPDRHVIATISLDARVLNGLDCGDAFFGPSVPWQCTPNPSGRTVTCGARRMGPCNVSDPNDMIVCDVLNAVDAEARHLAQQGVYHGGPCDELPGFVSSPDVSCYTSDWPGGFAISASHPQARWSCTWNTDIAPPNSKLVCY